VKIRIIHPVVRGALDDDVLPPLPPFVEAESDWLEEGPTSIECRYDEALVARPVLERMKAAAADGVDGIVVNCFMDPALQPGRELVHVPVAGPGQSSMTLAATLGQTFSVILPAASGEPIVVDQAVAYTGRDRLASVRSVEMPVADLHDAERLVPALVEQGREAVVRDGAHVIILGCTGMCGVTAAFRREMEALGLGTPVIDPTLAAVSSVVAQTITGVVHSARAYAVPSWRTVVA
jgi:allantoin racemase